MIRVKMKCNKDISGEVFKGNDEVCLKVFSNSSWLPKYHVFRIDILKKP